MLLKKAHQVYVQWQSFQIQLTCLVLDISLNCKEKGTVSKIDNQSMIKPSGPLSKESSIFSCLQSMR